MTRAPSKTKAPARAPFVPGYLAYLLARASHLVSGQFHARLRARGIPVPTWRVLATLSDGDGMTVGELARIALTNQPTMTKIVIRLETDGMVERRDDPGDGRRTLVFITPAGWHLIEDLLIAARDHEAQVLKEYSADEVRTLKRVLRTLIGRMSD